MMNSMQLLKSPSRASTATTATMSENNDDFEANAIRSASAAMSRRRASDDQDSGDVERDFVESQKALEHETKRLELLMESVIPKHLIGELQKAMMAPSKSNFQRSYLEYYESASILFADIVGFTKISSKCKANELVTMLNELFGRFDKAADSRRCLRIKILGDCYYCVSGVPPADPERAEPHARQCVEMGLDMIDILETLAFELRVPSDHETTTTRDSNSTPSNESSADDEAAKGLKMRIGIHTGQVVCGIMGKKKWQFDVHSSDVKLANHMEQGGLPGRVHITEVTLRHLAREYEVEPANGRERDAYIASRDMETFFVIAPPNRRKNSSLIPAGHLMRSDNAKAPPVCEREARQFTTPMATIVDRSGRTSVAPSGSVNQSVRLVVTSEPQDVVVTIDQSNETRALLTAAASQDSGSSLPLGNRLASVIKAIDADDENEVAICSKRDGSHLMRGKSKSQQSVQMPSLINSLTDRDLAHNRANANNPAIATTPTALNSGLARFKKTTRKIINANTFIRTIDPPFANLDSDPNDEIDKTICDAEARRAQIDNLNSWTLKFKDVDLGRDYVRKRGPAGARIRMIAQQFLEQHKAKLISWVLVAVALSMLAVGSSSLIETPPNGPQSNNLEISLILSAGALVIMTSIILTVARHVHRVERKSRTNFIYHTRILQKQEELNKTRKCNRSIFFNILPKHVAEHFLRSDRIGRELYSRPYNSVGVSFATVTNFETFFLEGEANDHGKGCLNLLNEMICDFDDLLDLQHFKGIDKIKTIGTTYMTAIGLVPKQDLTMPPTEFELAHQLKTILELIMEMRLCLVDINKNSFGSYRLRAGISIGPVTAGVIGANKPQYDIWGNTVNVASRMESTCEPNKIQVTKEACNLLKSYFPEECEFSSRGEINIKGKGMMETFYVELPRYESLKTRTQASN